MIRALFKLASLLLLFTVLSSGNPKRIARYAARRAAHKGVSQVDEVAYFPHDNWTLFGLFPMRRAQRLHKENGV